MRSLVQTPLFNVLAFSIIWAIQIVVTKLAFLAGADVLAFTLESTTFAIIAGTILLLPRCRKDLLRVAPIALLGILTANAIHNGFGGFLSNLGTKLTSAINAGFLMQCSTVTTILFAWLFLNEALTRAKVVTVLIILFGSFLLLTNGLMTAPGTGDVVILFACCAWSAANVIIRKLLHGTEINPDIISFLRPIAGLPTNIFLFSAYDSFAGTDFFNYDFAKSSEEYWYSAANGTLCVLVWFFLNRTLKVASASYMTMLSSLTPVFVAIFAVAFLGEHMSALQIAGGALIVLSGFVVVRLKL